MRKRYGPVLAANLGNVTRYDAGPRLPRHNNRGTSPGPSGLTVSGNKRFEFLLYFDLDSAAGEVARPILTHFSSSPELK